jgi:hypothetical protein
VREGLGSGPLLLLCAEPQRDQLELLGGELRPVGPDGAVLALAPRFDVEHQVRIAREVEDDPLERVGLVAAIHLGPGPQPRHALQEGGLGDGAPHHQVVAVRLVGQPGIDAEHEVGSQPADVLDDGAAQVEVVVLARIRQAEPELLRDPDLHARLVLLFTRVASSSDRLWS